MFIIFIRFLLLKQVCKDTLLKTTVNMGKGEGSGSGKGTGLGSGSGEGSGEDYKGKTERLAVPAMPAPAAVICCVLNFLIPGFGK